MLNIGYEQVALFEHRFWLQILGDHARFILGSLAPDETEAIAQAQRFIGLFDRLLTIARGQLNDLGLRRLSSEANDAAEALRQFKLELLRRHLVGMIHTSLPPTFFNHMLNELEEYMYLLGFLMEGKIPPTFNPVHYHLLWLLDAVGHADTLFTQLDAVEARLREISANYKIDFQNLYLKANEMSGYMRTGLEDFPALGKLSAEATTEMREFMDFLMEIHRLRVTKEALGTIDPLVPDHMFREECYYITKVNETAGVAKPDCDPTRPRTVV